MGVLKHERIGELPHYGHDALFFQNDEITTWELNNKTEVKIHLITGQFLYFDMNKDSLSTCSRPDLRKNLWKS